MNVALSKGNVQVYFRSNCLILCPHVHSFGVVNLPVAVQHYGLTRWIITMQVVGRGPFRTMARGPAPPPAKAEKAPLPNRRGSSPPRALAWFWTKQPQHCFVTLLSVQNSTHSTVEREVLKLRRRLFTESLALPHLLLDVHHVHEALGSGREAGAHLPHQGLDPLHVDAGAQA